MLNGFDQRWRVRFARDHGEGFDWAAASPWPLESARLASALVQIGAPLAGSVLAPDRGDGPTVEAAARGAADRRRAELALVRELVTAAARTAPDREPEPARQPASRESGATTPTAAVPHAGGATAAPAGAPPVPRSAAGALSPPVAAAWVDRARVGALLERHRGAARASIDDAAAGALAARPATSRQSSSSALTARDTAPRPSSRAPRPGSMPPGAPSAPPSEPSRVDHPTWARPAARDPEGAQPASVRPGVAVGRPTGADDVGPWTAPIAPAGVAAAARALDRRVERRLEAMAPTGPVSVRPTRSPADPADLAGVPAPGRTVDLGVLAAAPSVTAADAPSAAHAAPPGAVVGAAPPAPPRPAGLAGWSVAPTLSSAASDVAAPISSRPRHAEALQSSVPPTGATLEWLQESVIEERVTELLRAQARRRGVDLP